MPAKAKARREDHGVLFGDADVVQAAGKLALEAAEAGAFGQWRR